MADRWLAGGAREGRARVRLTVRDGKRGWGTSAAGLSSALSAGGGGALCAVPCRAAGHGHRRCLHCVLCPGRWREVRWQARFLLNVWRGCVRAPPAGRCVPAQRTCKGSYQLTASDGNRGAALRLVVCLRVRCMLSHARRGEAVAANPPRRGGGRPPCGQRSTGVGRAAVQPEAYCWPRAQSCCNSPAPSRRWRCDVACVPRVNLSLALINNHKTAP